MSSGKLKMNSITVEMKDDEATQKLISFYDWTIISIEVEKITDGPSKKRF